MSEIRHELIKIVRKMCAEQLVLGTWGNVSARQDDSFWITPSGMDYQSLTWEDLVRVEVASGKDQGRWKPSSEWRLHAAIYRKRPDCKAIVHTHSIYATAFAVARAAIPPITEEMAQVVGGSVEVADYALAGTWQLAENAAQALGDKAAVLLANHGLVGVAATLPEALKVCQIVEKTAQVALLSRMLGPVSPLCAEDVSLLRNFYLTSYGPKKNGEE
ncbi:MAG: class II aldolase/adducin family protein [Firmicutes bacterium]|nr:class II aldolase/adducin family protein [Bacillota bacterium]